MMNVSVSRGKLAVLIQRMLLVLLVLTLFTTTASAATTYYYYVDVDSTAQSPDGTSWAAAYTSSEIAN